MGKESKIGWTDHTFNAWWGCEKIAPECALCYAATFAHRYGHEIWGKDAPRRFFGDKHWNEPLKWHLDAVNRGVRERVFCCSMADVFEAREDVVPHRQRLFELIKATPSLDYLLLTKRPENIPMMVPHLWRDNAPPNVWYGTTAGCQATANQNGPRLLDARSRVRFLSCEPLIGPLDLFKVPRPDNAYFQWRGETGLIGPKTEPDDFVWACKTGIQWVIVGGESGHGARPFDLAWARTIRDQCREAGVAFFMKQLGSKPVENGKPYPISDSKGEVMADWPADLRIQEFPDALVC